LTSKQDCYYDLLVGSHIEYKNTKPRKYYFTSFDEEDVFYINYSIENREIKKINNGHFFFWHAMNILDIDKNLINKEFFIYIINPPDFNFKYSLCIINKTQYFENRKDI
jgi:hypothetical protein